MGTPPSAPCPANRFLANHAKLLLASYRHWLTADLLAPQANDEETARRMYEADFAILSHGTGSDPHFNYANLAAQKLFEMDWNTLLATPSRLSAEPIDREEREKLLAEVAARGYISNYTGIRVSRTGKRFRIDNALVWNLIDPCDGGLAGQAALLRHWQALP